MRDAVIVEAVRSPMGKRGGTLSGTHPADLSAHVLRALAERSGFDVSLVDDVIWGCVNAVNEQSGDIARTALLSAGWPEEIPGVTIDRQCGSSQQAVSFAAACVISGQYDFVVAGGVEAMSIVPIDAGAKGGNPFAGTGWVERYGHAANQGIGAEMIAERWGLSRTQVDEYSVRSHERADAARSAGAFEAQIAPIETATGLFSADEGIRPGSTVEKLGNLKPAFKPDGVITAGNASQITDGAGALLITSSELAAQHGLTPLVRVHTASVAGSEPMIMLTGPIPATHKVLQRSGLALSDIGAFEVNEAFAP
ncbi:MAG: Acetyl-CoA acetyltransferase with thiolase domain, partial [Frankiales bacterium]|nr:Acetyl-CoA acetyltransferase with thiolase domain [Frankiales bacterium]